MRSGMVLAGPQATATLPLSSAGMDHPEGPRPPDAAVTAPPGPIGAEPDDDLDLDDLPLSGSVLDVDTSAPVDAAPPPLEVLRAELETTADTPPLTLQVPTRPGYSVRFRTTIDPDEITAWRKRARDKKSPDGVDPFKLAALVAVNCAEVVIRQGVELEGQDGQPYNFRHPELLGFLQEGRAAHAAAKFFGGAALLNATDAVLEAGGWGDAAEVDDSLDPSATGA